MGNELTKEVTFQDYRVATKFDSTCTLEGIPSTIVKTGGGGHANIAWFMKSSSCNERVSGKGYEFMSWML